MDVTQRPVPPIARRPIVAPTAALKEEITDSWRLLLGCLGAAITVTFVLYLLTILAG
jgi:hypothetical protein